MNVCISPKLRRLALRGLLTLAAAVTPALSQAGDLDCGSEIASTMTWMTTCNFELEGTEELCGWGDDCPPGTHISGVLPTPAPQATLPPAPVASPSAESKTSLDKSVAAIATAAFASAGIAVEQIVEPFAMVGPYLDNSLETVREFQAWWKSAQTEAESMKTASDAIQDELDRIATLEPIDVESFGPSVVVKRSVVVNRRAVVEQSVIVNRPPVKQPAIEPGIQVTAINALIGSSPIIATIEETYQPYDLSARDLKLWSVFPTATRPFCVRSHMQALEDSSMWEDFDQAVQAETPVAPSVEFVANCGSAYCLLDELVWQFDNWVADDSAVSVAIQPYNIGRKFAAIATGGSRIFRGAAQLLASNWPESEAELEPEPSSTGQALLARAGAVQASEIVAETSAGAQIAEAPSGTTLR